MKAINFRKTLLTSAAILGLSTSVNAADETLGFSFQTIPDVTIAQVTPLDFGGGLQLAINSSCELAVTDDSGTYNPSSVDARVADGTGFAEGVNYNERQGSCNDGTLGTVGKYVITGAEGVEVNIDVNGISPGAGNFAFVPQAVVASHGTVTAADSSLVELTLSGIVASGAATLARSTDTGTGGSPIPGQSFLYIGGTITNENTLLAGTTYADQQFVVDVVY